jgi:hypothetical protein
MAVKRFRSGFLRWLKKRSWHKTKRWKGAVYKVIDKKHKTYKNNNKQLKQHRL